MRGTDVVWVCLECPEPGDEQTKVAVPRSSPGAKSSVLKCRRCKTLNAAVRVRYRFDVVADVKAAK